MASFSPYRLPWYQRTVMALFGAVLVVVLIVAAFLTPSQQGFGTHHQLGLQPCSFIQLFGFRCPSCGMTTSWAHTMNADLVAAVKANSGGALLALLSIFTGPWLLVSAAVGRWWWRQPNEWVVVAIAVLVVVVTIADWTYRLSTTVWA